MVSFSIILGFFILIGQGKSKEIKADVFLLTYYTLLDVTDQIGL